ncbi:ion transporter [Bradymonas sediminis]|uniref:ion transporter n=1 Tax=Bradymonas sediminis TaxID=1548548 RepID=UPI00105CCCA2|nr:ion transporter [Bradymonas sediminis]TDP63709.1 voltage-gated potassium channel [Bradymonas sediminis]
MKKLRRQFYYLLEDDHADTLGPQIVEYGLATLITINIIALMLSTMPELQAYDAAFVAIERLSVVLFSVEYILRVWCVAERLEDPFWGRVKFIFHPLMLIDLMAVAPGYFTGPLDLRFARSFRLIRILKLTRHSTALSLIIEVLRRKREELFSVALISVLMLVMASGMIYYAEHPTQPEAFSSIPESMWWAVMTMTTVGYGDVTPVTTAGRIIGGLVALTGVGFFAMPAGILAYGFSEVISEKKQKLKEAKRPR